MSGSVLISAYAPERRSGSGLRTCGVIAALAARESVDVHYVPFEGRVPAPEIEALPNVRLQPVAPQRGLSRALAVADARARGATPSLARTASRELLAAARDAEPGARLIADGPNVAAALLGLAGRRPLVYLAHNLESAFRDAPGMVRFERRVLHRYAESWMPTHADMAGARELAGPEPRLRYVPNVVDVAATPTPTPTERAVLFVADFTYPPNREGLAFLTEQVLPAVWEQDPDVGLLLVGRGLDAPPADPRIEALGFVEDLETAYARAGVVAVPLITGGGSPLKFVEALAHGLPVVATTHAAALLEEGHAGEHFLAAADAPAFAHALLDALDGGDPGLGARGRALAERSYSVAALTELLAAA